MSFSVDDVLVCSHLAALTCLFRAIGPKERRSMQMSFSICKEKYQGKNKHLSSTIRGQYYLLREHGAVPGAEAATHGVTHDDGLLPAQVIQHTPANQTNQRPVMRSHDQFRPIRGQWWYWYYLRNTNPSDILYCIPAGYLLERPWPGWSTLTR